MYNFFLAKSLVNIPKYMNLYVLLPAAHCMAYLFFFQAVECLPPFDYGEGPAERTGLGETSDSKGKHRKRTRKKPPLVLPIIDENASERVKYSKTNCKLPSIGTLMEKIKERRAGGGSHTTGLTCCDMMYPSFQSNQCIWIFRLMMYSIVMAHIFLIWAGIYTHFVLYAFVLFYATTQVCPWIYLYGDNS